MTTDADRLKQEMNKAYETEFNGLPYVIKFGEILAFQNEAARGYMLAHGTSQSLVMNASVIGDALAAVFNWQEETREHIVNGPTPCTIMSNDMVMGLWENEKDAKEWADSMNFPEDFYKILPVVDRILMDKLEKKNEET